MTLPIPKMPTPTPVLDQEVHRLLDAYAKRLDQLGLINRDGSGNFVLQLPPIGAGSTEQFNTDHMTVRLDGSYNFIGSIELPTRTVVSPAACRSTDSTILCDATNVSVGHGVFLPAANLVPGRIYIIKKIDSSTNAVTITPHGNDLIDGAASYILSAQWNGAIIQSTGLGWFILATIPYLSPRVVSMADATHFKPAGDFGDIFTQVNTQIAGNLSAQAPNGAVWDGRTIELIIKSTNVQTFVWDAMYTGCTTTALPVASTGGGKTDKFWFQYNALSNKWEIFNAQFGY